MCPSCQESHETLNWDNLFHVVSPFFLPPVGRSLSKSINKPMKLRFNTNECDISWFKTTIYDENVIMHTYSSRPLKGDIQNHTCKSYLKALFHAYISSPFKGDIQKHQCESYRKEFFHAYISSPIKGDLQNYTCKSYLEALR